MENLELKSVKELRETAQGLGVELPKRCGKEEIISLINEVIQVDEPIEETKWFEDKISGRTLKKLSLEQLFEYPGLASLQDADLEDLKSAPINEVRAFILLCEKEKSKATDTVLIEKEENFNFIKALIFEKTVSGTKKLVKEEIASIRKAMQGKTFTAAHREEIKDMIESNRLKMAKKFEIGEFFEYVDAKVDGDTVTFMEGDVVKSLPKYEVAVRCAVRDYGESMAYEIKKFIEGSISEITLLDKVDRYTEMSYELIINDIDALKQEEVIAEIERLYDADRFPIDYWMLSIPEVEKGCEIEVVDTIGKSHKMRVCQSAPLIVQPYGNYFMGGTSYVDKRYFPEFKKVTLSKMEVFNKYATEDYLENKYDATKDPAVTEEALTPAE